MGEPGTGLQSQRFAMEFGLISTICSSQELITNQDRIEMFPFSSRPTVFRRGRPEGLLRETPIGSHAHKMPQIQPDASGRGVLIRHAGTGRRCKSFATSGFGLDCSLEFSSDVVGSAAVTVQS
jgi:hypothetical protein